jgi:uroporphyrinogen decarboxylase
MLSRDRVLSALNHREPDLVPIDLGAHRSSGVAAIAYARLRDYLGLPRTPLRVYDITQQLAIVDEDVLDRFGVDALELGRGFSLQETDWVDWSLPDGTPCQVPAWTVPAREEGRWVLRSRTGRTLAQMPDGALYLEGAYYPFAEGGHDRAALSEVLDECSIPGVPGPSTDGPRGEPLLVQGARRLRERTQRAIVGIFGGNLLETGNALYRNDNFLTLLADDPAQVEDFLDRLTEHHLAKLERFLRLVGSSIDIILFGDDLGMQTGPQMSPRMYRALFKPRHARLWKRAKELADVKVMLHCCGGVRPLLPDLIDAGLDAINPVQISCAGMDAAGLKRDFGRDITFWGGGCDTQWTLGHATPDQVREHVKRQAEIMRPGGGFVFQQVHNVLANVPPQNVVAMLDAVNGP